MSASDRGGIQSCGEPDEHLMRAYNCGDKGKCWMWCKDQSTRASSAGASNAKWCYTSNPNTCSTFENCASLTSCVNSNCNINC